MILFHFDLELRHQVFPPLFMPGDEETDWETEEMEINKLREGKKDGRKEGEKGLVWVWNAMIKKNGDQGPSGTTMSISRSQTQSSNNNKLKEVKNEGIGKEEC